MDRLVVNMFGRVTRVPESVLTEALGAGCRLLDDVDLAYLKGRAGAMPEIPSIDGMARGAWGSVPVLVVGKGPSAVRKTPKGWRRIVVNQADITADAVVALDTAYWESNEGGKAQAPLMLKPKGTAGRPDCTSFTMPFQVASGGLEIEQADGLVTNAHFSGIVAVLVAQYLSTGPVVLSGFDLTGTDEAGAAYERQFPAFKAMAAVLPRVFTHHAMTGPVSMRLPVWRTRAASDEWVLIGGGPTRIWAREALGRDVRVGVCNAGITVCANPDMVWHTDPQALVEYKGRVEFAEAHGAAVMNDRNFPYLDKGVEFHGTSSGVLLLRAAITKGAKKITLYGYDGYKDRLEVTETMAEALGRAIAENPDVSVTFIDPECIMAQLAKGAVAA